MKRIKAIVALLTTIFLLPVPSWAVSSPRVIEGAKKEGRLVFWTAMNLSQSKLVVSRFEKRYPFMRVMLHRTGGIALVDRALKEHREGRYPWDLVSGRGEMYPPLMKKGLLAPYRSPEVKGIPREFVDNKGYWTTIYITPYVLGYNTQLVKKEDVPKTYEDLLHPRWSDKKISIDTEAFGFLAGLIKAWGKKRTVSYLSKLAAQQPILRRGNTFRTQLAMAGEFPLVIAYSTVIQRYTSRGAPIDWVPLEPVPVQLDLIMLGAKASHPNAAKLFIDFVLSEEGQKMLVKLRRIPVRRGIHPNPPQLYNGFNITVVNPEGGTDFSEVIKFYRQIFKLG